MVTSKYFYYCKSIFNLISRFSPLGDILSVFLGIKSQAEWQVFLKKEKLAFFTRGKMDIWSIKETFVDRFYEREQIHLSDGMTVVDIGAGIGEFSIRAAAGYPHNRVIALEPYLPSFFLLQRNVTLNRLTNVQCENCAVSGRDGFIYLDLSTQNPLQLQTVQSEQAPEKTGLLEVPALSLDSVFSKYAIETCDVLKLDCEGAEYDILFNASAGVLNKIKAITMEYHDTGGRTHVELYEFLKKNGFRPDLVANPVHKEIGYLYAHHDPG